jgi:thioredoxin 1
MMKTFIGRAALGSLVLALANITHAGEAPYNKAQFDEQVAAGKPTVVYLHATWCPTCKIQQPIVDRLSSDAEFKSLTVFEADYDKETALKKSLRITQQSTFVVFKGGHEVARSTGETTEPAIRKTFEAAL